MVYLLHTQVVLDSLLNTYLIIFLSVDPKVRLVVLQVDGKCWLSEVSIKYFTVAICSGSSYFTYFCLCYMDLKFQSNSLLPDPLAFRYH